MRNKNILILLLLSTALLAGCNSGLNYETEIRKIDIKTSPTNATVYQINPVTKHETYLGLSPIRQQPVPVIKNFAGSIIEKTQDYMTTQLEMVNVRIEKPGYLPYLGNLPTNRKKTTSHRIDLEEIRQNR